MTSKKVFDSNFIWRKYRQGDSISDEEMLFIFNEAKAAFPYLAGRLPLTYLAYVELITHLNNLEGCLKARKCKFTPWCPTSEEKEAAQKERAWEEKKRNGS